MVKVKNTMKIKTAFINTVILLLLSILPAFSQPDQDYIEIKLIEKVLTNITYKQSINVCIINYDTNKMLHLSTSLRITKCENADFIIIGKDAKDINYNKPAIVLNEDSIEKAKNAVGYLYWKKGRPQLIFIKSRLDKYKIQLPNEYKGYLADKTLLNHTS